MTRGRWLLVIPIVALAAWMGTRLLRPVAMPYEGINDAPRDFKPHPDAAPEPALVDVLTVAPTLILDVRYATANNFLHKPVYPVARVLLRRDAAERLARVQTALQKDGLGLKVFDGYRPLSVQKVMWALVPDERYVANPAKGGRHNRAMAVDVTLVDAAGKELPMPTDFDDFTPAAAADAPASEPARTNRARLRAAMEQEGFTIMPTEWWHFDAPGWEKYPVLDVPLEAGNLPPGGR